MSCEGRAWLTDQPGVFSCIHVFHKGFGRPLLRARVKEARPLYFASTTKRDRVMNKTTIGRFVRDKLCASSRLDPFGGICYHSFKVKGNSMGNLKVALAAACAVVVGAYTAVAATCTYTGTWDVTPTSAEDAIVIESGTLAWDVALPQTVASWTQNGGTVTFKTGRSDNANTIGVEEGDERVFKVTGNVTINGGTVMHAAQPSMTAASAGWIDGKGVYRLIMDVGGNMTVAEEAKISADGRGFLRKEGPGGGSQGIGGSHGGCGNASCGRCYGSPITPETIGSGGRDEAGGGAISLTVGGNLVLNGPVSANGSSDGTDYRCAGGSVLLVASSISGTGAISANAYGHTSQRTGGGGRIALKLTGAGDFSGLTGTLTAHQSINNGNGAAGTIYYETSAQAGGHGRLVVSGLGSLPSGDLSSELGCNGETLDFSEIVLQNGAAIGVRAGATVKTAKLTVNGSTASRITLLGGRMEIPADAIYENLNIVAYHADSKISCGSGEILKLGADSVLTCYKPLTVGELVMNSGAKVTHPANGATLSYNVDLTVTGDATIDSGASINADVLGVTGSTLYGAPACHGGVAPGCAASLAYGSVRQPVTSGSIAGAGRTEIGGGVIRFSVGGALTLNGTITASGGFANTTKSSSSGGSVWIDCGTLAGAGAIRANAGTAKSGVGMPGAGGRVAVHLNGAAATFDAFCDAGGVIEACGCIVNGNTVPVGPCGTVYLSQIVNGNREGTLVVANRNSNYRAMGAAIGARVTDAEVDHIRIETNGVLIVGQDATLTVRGNWTKAAAGKFVAEDGDADHAAGSVQFAGTGTSVIGGSTDFANLTCVTPGKTLKFGTGDDNLTRITSTGRLTLTGEADNPIVLRSVQDGTQWEIALMPGAASEVVGVDVKDSDAGDVSQFATIVAKDSVDSLNNLNWSFKTIVIGATNTWKGTVDSVWSTPANWSENREPADTDFVVIPARDVENMPTLGASVTLNSLTVEAGASLNLAGRDLCVTNVLTVRGGLVCSAAERIMLSGPTVDFGGGTFERANSVLELVGDGDQSVDFGVSAFNVVRYAKPGGTLTQTSGLKAYQVYVTATAPFECRFAAGTRTSVDDLYVSGAVDGTSLLAFGSTNPGSVWELSVARHARVQGVAIADSDASSGIPLYDDLPGSAVGGNNRNWTFGTKACHWIGGTGTSFTNAANWAGNEAPGVDSRVCFDGDATVSLDCPCTVREVTVSAGTTVVPYSTNVLTVVRSLTVEGGAKLSMNAPLSVANNLIVRADGVLTHEAQSSALIAKACTNRLQVAMGGDLVVEAKGSIDVSRKGFSSVCQGGYGLGNKHGASHGGGGFDKRDTQVIACYDSFFRPSEPGSSCVTGDAGNEAGGVAILHVGGVVTVEGSIRSDSGSGDSYVASGGSIWITARDLAGAGTITADCGSYLFSSSSPAGGGRIAVWLDEGVFANWSGTMTAYPTRGDSGVGRPAGEPGTIYLQRGDEGDLCGTVYVRGMNDAIEHSGYAFVEIPVEGWNDKRDFENVKFVISGSAAVKFAADMKIADIDLQAVGTVRPQVFLDDHVVKVETLDHRKGRGWCDGYDNLVNAGPEGRGQFLWPQKGMMLFVR